MANRKVVIFGVFDGIHDGHRYFIKEAKKFGNQLVAIVARDSVVQYFKNKSPLNNEVSRIDSLLKLEDIDLVLLGDPKHSTYNVLKELNPDVICLGYDQKDLYKDIELSIKMGAINNTELIFIDSLDPNNLHSSIINNKTNS